MTFRDDTDALSAKVESLQTRLDDAQSKLTAVEPRLAEVDQLERELEEAKAELAKHTRPKPSRSRWGLLAIGGAGAFVFLAGVFGFLLLSPEKEEASVVEVAATPADAERAVVAQEAQAAWEEARAAERQRAALAGQPIVIRRGRVVSVEGAAPTTAEAECTLRVEHPGRPDFDARVRVDCGGRRIYGRDQAGLVECHMRDDAPERCEDRGGTAADSDPMLTLDLPTDVVVVADGPEMAWTVRIALAPDA